MFCTGGAGEVYGVDVDFSVVPDGADILAGLENVIIFIFLISLEGVVIRWVV